MRDFMNIVKALGDENRVRALLALRTSELCVCQIIELLGLAPSTVSKHMSILKQARLVDTRENRVAGYFTGWQEMILDPKFRKLSPGCVNPLPEILPYAGMSIGFRMS